RAVKQPQAVPRSEGGAEDREAKGRILKARMPNRPPSTHSNQVTVTSSSVYAVVLPLEVAELSECWAPETEAEP
ncbi:Uncharacterized, partial [Moorella glycerini]